MKLFYEMPQHGLKAIGVIASPELYVNVLLNKVYD